MTAPTARSGHIEPVIATPWQQFPPSASRAGVQREVFTTRPLAGCTGRALLR